MRGHRRANAWVIRRAHLQFVRRTVRRAGFYCSRLVRLFPEPVQSHTRRHARWRPDRDRSFTLALAPGVCSAALVRLVLPQFRRLADRDLVIAAHLFALPSPHGRGTRLLRSHAGAALDDVDLVFRSDGGPDFRNAPRPARPAQLRRPLPWSWPGRDLPVDQPAKIKAARSRVFESAD